jgi:RNA recognition motif-containing protein
MDARLAVESCTDRISFGLSALGIALFQRGSLPMTATLVSLSSQNAGLSCYRIFFVSIPKMTKLYVGNLPFTATEDSVRALFAPHGTVESLSLVTDRETGSPRGFGFVEMANADAARAMQALNGVDFNGRALRINEAQSKERSNGNDRGRPRHF